MSFNDVTKNEIVLRGRSIIFSFLTLSSFLACVQDFYMSHVIQRVAIPSFLTPNYSFEVWKL